MDYEDMVFAYEYDPDITDEEYDDYYEGDIEIGYNPYMGCYSDDC